MNITQMKELLDSHINMAFYVKNILSELDVMQLLRLEHQIIEGEDFKDIMPSLEAKMCRQMNI